MSDDTARPDSTAAPGDRVLGEIGTELLFENELVKIWELRLAPGESSPIHEHHHPHVLIPISGDRIAGESEPDSKGPHTDYVEAGVRPGAATYYKAGGIETAINVGQDEFLQVIVEVKGVRSPEGDTGT